MLCIAIWLFHLHGVGTLYLLVQCMYAQIGTKQPTPFSTSKRIQNERWPDHSPLHSDAGADAIVHLMDVTRRIPKFFFFCESALHPSSRRTTQSNVTTRSSNTCRGQDSEARAQIRMPHKAVRDETKTKKKGHLIIIVYLKSPTFCASS